MAREEAKADESSFLPPIGVVLLVGVCFFATGAAGLIYEVVWNRMLVLLMGNTSYSLATLLTVFMGGLALGAWLGGRLAPAGVSALRAYGLLELGIGLYCLLLPILIETARPLFGVLYRDYYGSLAAFNLAQFVVVGALLIVPTTLMGATLPILVRFLTSRLGILSRTTAALYSVNSGGAFVGCMFAGLLLLPTQGVRISYLVAVAINLLVGVVALGMSYRGGTRPAKSKTGPAGRRRRPLRRTRKQPRGVAEQLPAAIWAAPTGGRLILLCGYAFCGFAAMVYQVAWTRSVTMAIGSSTYAFTLIAGAFILGLTLGSAVLGWMGDRAWGRFLLALLPIAIGLSAMMSVVLLANLPVRMSRVLAAASQFSDVQRAEFRTLFLMFLPATFAMGGLLPLVTRYVARTREEAGRSVGSAYAANAAGTILGSFCGGFVLIPWVGMRNSIVVGAVMSIVVGAAFWYLILGLRSRFAHLAVAVTGAMAILCVVLAPRWDESVVNSAPYFDANKYVRSGLDTDDAIRERMQQNILYYKEGVSAVVAVTESGLPKPVRSMLVGGRLDAISVPAAQNFLGHLPLLFRPEARDVLVIGLGAGQTLSAVECHSVVQAIDCVEISEEVVYAARELFSEYTDSALDDPRANLIVGDGRLHLEYTEKKYDVIISQPSHPWVVGASGLFTEEAFRAMKRCLRPGGVVCIWFQDFRPEGFRMLCRTWSDVWKHPSVWTTTRPTQFLFIGSDAPLSFDFEALAAKCAEPRVAEQLEQLGVPKPAHILGRLLTIDEGVRDAAADAPLNTDDNSRIEFDTPRGIFRSLPYEFLLLGREQRVDPWKYVTHDDVEDAAYLENRRLAARILADQRKLVASLNLPPQQRVRVLEELLRRNPRDARIKMELEQAQSQLPRFGSSPGGSR